MTSLQKMKAADFAAFNEINIKLLSEVFENRLSPEEAAKKAEDEQAKLLPYGANTDWQLYIRNYGIGTQAMKLPEAEAGTLGLPAVRLHVIKNDTAAVRVYRKPGY